MAIPGNLALKLTVIVIIESTGMLLLTDATF